MGREKRCPEGIQKLTDFLVEEHATIRSGHVYELQLRVARGVRKERDVSTCKVETKNDWASQTNGE
jgi:hypothetical protein